jgi:hypothetical protein
MATKSGDYLDRDGLGQSGPLLTGIGVCTALLTASFLGMVALAAGAATGLVARMPLYVLGSSVSFVGVLLAVDDRHRDGSVVLARASGAAVTTFVLGVLGAEGVVYALTSPEAVVASHLFVYLLSAAIIASGLGYWGVQHWGEVRSVVGDRHL